MFAILRSKELDFRCPLFKFEVASCEGSIMEEEKIFEKRWELASIEQRARYHTFVSTLENRINSLAIVKAFEQWHKKKRSF